MVVSSAEPGLQDHPVAPSPRLSVTPSPGSSGSRLRLTRQLDSVEALPGWSRCRATCTRCSRSVWGSMSTPGTVWPAWSVQEPRLRARRLVLGLLSDLPRKKCWTISEWVGESSPHGMQHLLSRAVGTLTPCVMTCGNTSSSTFTTMPRCWSSTRPAMWIRAPHRRRPAPVHGTAGRIENAQVAATSSTRAGTRVGGPGAVHPALLDVRPVLLPGSRTW